MVTYTEGGNPPSKEGLSTSAVKKSTSELDNTLSMGRKGEIGGGRGSNLRPGDASVQEKKKSGGERSAQPYEGGGVIN